MRSLLRRVRLRMSFPGAVGVKLIVSSAFSAAALTAGKYLPLSTLLYLLSRKLLHRVRSLLFGAAQIARSFP